MTEQQANYEVSAIVTAPTEPRPVKLTAPDGQVYTLQQASPPSDNNIGEIIQQIDEEVKRLRDESGAFRSVSIDINHGRHDVGNYDVYFHCAGADKSFKLNGE